MGALRTEYFIICPFVPLKIPRNFPRILQINSFELADVSCEAISDLHDGVLLLKVLHAM